MLYISIIFSIITKEGHKNYEMVKSSAKSCRYAGFGCPGKWKHLLIMWQNKNA